MVLMFLDMEDGNNLLNGMQVHSPSELLNIFESRHGRPSFFGGLTGGTGESLIGVGETGYVQPTASDSSSAHLIAVSLGHEHGAGYFEILAGGTPTPVRAPYCLPFDLVKKITPHFQETRLRSSVVSWEEI